jgi:hypothetical protein
MGFPLSIATLLWVCCVYVLCSVQTNRRTGRSLVLTFYGIPTEPGKSKVITAFFTNSKVRGDHMP